MGYFKIKDGRYRIVARLRSNGMIKHRQLTVDCGKETAKALSENLKRELREGKRPDCSLITPKTFGEVLNFYTERKGAGKSGCYFNRLLSDLGNVTLDELPDRFDRYIQLLKHSTGKNTGRPIKNGTINQYLMRAKAALNFAASFNLIDKNPLKNFKKFKEIARDIVLSEIEIQRLMNAIGLEAPHLSAIVHFALQVPCRRSELVNMRRNDLDLFNNSIRVRNGTTKNDTGYWKPIPPDMEEYFRNIPGESEYLFYKKHYTGYRYLGDFKKSWKRCLKIAGINDFRFHDLRHISASALVDNGTPEQVVMQVANWRTNMLRTYYHRSGRESLKLVRFIPQCDSVVIVQGEKKAVSG